MSRRALLIGGSGRLGSAIRSGWAGWEIASPARGTLELEDAAALPVAIAEHAPGVVVNCAAYHDVDRCEREPARALAINAIAVETAARSCRERGVAFVTISTDYVFDGALRRPYREEDCPHPLSVYGVSKLAGELLVERFGAGVLVVRTCGVFGLPRPNAGGSFVERLLAGARAGAPLRVVADSIVSPTFAGHLAAAIEALVRSGATGLYHAAGAGAVSWHGFACELLRRAGSAARVEAIATADWKAPAPRPRYSALDSSKLAAATGYVMPSWEAGIAAYLQLYPLSATAPSP